MTRKFYTKDQFKAYAKQQIQENEDLIIAWRIVGELIENFDNKVINKRLKDYINDALKSEFKHTFFSFEKHNFAYGFMIWARDNDTYPAENGESVNYVNYQSNIYVEIGEDKRINAEIIIKNINHAMDYLIEENKTLKKEIKDIDNIEAEFLKIKGMIHDFENEKSRYIKGLYSFN